MRVLVHATLNKHLLVGKIKVTAIKHAISQNTEMFLKVSFGTNPDSIFHCSCGITIAEAIQYIFPRNPYWQTHLGLTSMKLRLQSLDWISPALSLFFLTGLSIQLHAGGEQG